MNIKKAIKTYPYLSTFIWLVKKVFWLLFVSVKYLLIFSLEIAGSGSAKYGGSYEKKDYTNHSLDIDNRGEDHDTQTSPLDKTDIY